jgi:HSP20 family protein
MAVTLYEPRSLVAQLQNDLNRIFSSFGTRAMDEPELPSGTWLPSVDIKEEPNRFVVRADLPGVDPKDIELSMHNGALSIRGKRETEKKEEKGGYLRTERYSGEFFRRFMLPDTADGEQVSARSEKGVLEIVIPKRQAAQAKKIEIKS